MLVGIGRATGLPLTRVGQITAGKMKLEVRNFGGQLYTPSRSGFNHFR